MLILSLVLLFTSYLFSRLGAPNRKLQLFIFVSGLAVGALTGLEVISDKLTGVGFNDAALYHALYGLEGAGFKEYLGLILESSLAIGVIALVWCFLVINKSLRTSKNFKFSKTLSLSVGLLAIALHPTFAAIKRMTFPQAIKEPLINFYETPKILERPTRKQNFVWIYLESVERTFLNENVFPGLTPNLKRLEASSLSFSNVAQVGSSGWTMAGLVASQCGVPLVSTGGHGNSMGALPSFLPGAVCVGDLLKKEGYTLSFLGGSGLEFAGKGKFMKTHGFSDVQGFHELSPQIDPNYRTGWGLYDDTTFDLALNKLDTLVETAMPFGLHVLTLDTHPPGHPSHRCEDIKYGDGTNLMLNAVHCTDHLVSTFIADIKRRAPDTLIIVSSDHLMMGAPLAGVSTDAERRNLLFFHHEGSIRPEKNDRPATTYSSGVTALNLLGYQVNGLGIGRPLQGERSTIRESMPEIAETISGWDPEFRKLWNLAEVASSFHIDPSKGFVSFSGAVYKTPLIIDISPDNPIPRLIYDDPDAQLNDMIVKLGPETHSIWMDTCLRISNAFGLESDSAPTDFCVWDDRIREVVHIPQPFDYKLGL